MLRFSILIVGFFLLLFISCTTESTCPGESVSKFRIKFIRKTDSTTNYFIIRNPVLNDSIYKSATAPGILVVPMDLNNDSLSFYIDFVVKTDSTYEQVTDVIVITYKSFPYMENLECGVLVDFEIDSVFYSNIHLDTLYFMNSTINSETVNHVEIYY